MAADDFYKRFLESLFFPHIHARQEDIAEAHKKTFEWIFDKSIIEAHPWHNLSIGLKADTELTGFVAKQVPANQH